MKLLCRLQNPNLNYRSDYFDYYIFVTSDNRCFSVTRYNKSILIHWMGIKRFLNKLNVLDKECKRDYTSVFKEALLKLEFNKLIEG